MPDKQKVIGSRELPTNFKGRKRLSSHSAEARRLLSPPKRELIPLQRQLVRTGNVAIPPGGHETPAQRVLYQFLKHHKLDLETVDINIHRTSSHLGVRRDRNCPGRKNLIARLPGRASTCSFFPMIIPLRSSGKSRNLRRHFANETLFQCLPACGASAF